MIPFAVGAFLGSFAAMVAFAEVQNASKIVRYLIILVLGLLIAVVAALLAGWVLAQFHKAG